jgi:hypothetical protein
MLRRRRNDSLGLIRFIGELFKLQMLTERTMHECVLPSYERADKEPKCQSPYAVHASGLSVFKYFLIGGVVEPDERLCTKTATARSPLMSASDRINIIRNTHNTSARQRVQSRSFFSAYFL